MDTALQHVHVKGEDDPLRRLGDEDLLDGDWTAALLDDVPNAQ